MKKTIILVIALLLVVGAVIVIANNTKEEFSLGVVDTGNDVIGTKSGTTITGVDFRVTGAGGQSATTSYITKISHNWDTAIYTFKVTEASTTANMQFEFLGSNDVNCDSEAVVNWTDASKHIRDIAYASSLAVGTTTVSWINPTVGTVRSVILTDLAYKCLAVEASGSSTQAWAQITGK